MPTITYDKLDLLNLIGRKMTDQELEEVINSIKPEVVKITHDQITLEHYQDRPDMYGIEGLARAIKLYTGREKPRKFTEKSSRIDIKVGSVPLRPLIAAAVIKNVKLTSGFIESLMNIQEVLHETIGRKRKKVAIGIHDLDKIFPPINYEAVLPSTKMVPLGSTKEMSLMEVLKENDKGRKYGALISQSSKWPVYSDAKGVFSFPPIINSDRTKVTPQTKNLLAELTGIDMHLLNQTLNILATGFSQRGGEIESVRILGKKIEVTPDLSEQSMEINLDELNDWIGLKMQPNQVSSLLEKMGYSSKDRGKKIEVSVPCYRIDILHQVDVFEDVAIAHGFNNFIPKIPNLSTTGGIDKLEKISSKIRQLMVGFGFLEVVLPVMSNQEEQFAKTKVKGMMVEIENPVSEEYTGLRVSLLPGLFRLLSKNRHVEYPQNIFEVGDIVVPDNDQETMSRTERKISGVFCHSKASFSEIKSLVESLMKNFGVNYQIEQTEEMPFIAGRGAAIYSGEMKLGIFGEIHPQVLENFGLEMPVASFEIDAELISMI